MYENEKDALTSGSDLQIQIEKVREGIYLNITVPEELLRHNGELVTTEQLGMPRIVEERYENPDGSGIVFNRDICGEKRNGNILAGPFCSLEKGKNRIMVWKKK